MRARPIQIVYLTPDFKKSFSKLPSQIQALAREKDHWFHTNAHDPRLKTHRLHGRLDGYWSYSINQQYRVLFKFLNAGSAIYYDVGTHAIYRK